MRRRCSSRADGTSRAGTCQTVIAAANFGHITRNASGPILKPVTKLTNSDQSAASLIILLEPSITGADAELFEPILGAGIDASHRDNQSSASGSLTRLTTSQEWKVFDTIIANRTTLPRSPLPSSDDGMIFVSPDFETAALIPSCCDHGALSPPPSNVMTGLGIPRAYCRVYVIINDTMAEPRRTRRRYQAGMVLKLHWIGKHGEIRCGRQS